MSPTGGWQADLPGVRERGDEWVTGPESCDRSGGARYMHLIRLPLDPERSPRISGTLEDPAGRPDRRPHLTMRKVAPAIYAEQIRALLEDGRARTFNAIGVELFDKTADILFQGPVDEALWSLVADGWAEHTLTTPVLFRRRKENQDMSRETIIHLTDRPAVAITDAEWPVIARAVFHDHDDPAKATERAYVRVRRHADGRTIVYGLRANAKRDHKVGFLLPAPADITGITEAVKNACALVGIEAQRVLDDMPPESL